MINNIEKNATAKAIYDDLIKKSKEEIIDICTSQSLVIFKREKEIRKLHSIIKEAIEYIQDRYDGEVLTHTFDKDNVKELLEILDKVEENTNGKD